jgi:hypothetical protein
MACIAGSAAVGLRAGPLLGRAVGEGEHGSRKKGGGDTQAAQSNEIRTNLHKKSPLEFEFQG